MRHLRMVGLCLIAVFALAAITAGSASAKSPEWGKCEAQVGGKYADGNCQTKASKGAGAFEWHKGASLPNVPFTGESQGGGGVLWGGFLECRHGPPLTKTPPSRSKCEEGGGEVVSNGALPIECEKENATGEAAGKSGIANVHVTFKGCALNGNIPCHNEGAAEGEIKTNPLKGSLGVINKEAKEIGALLEPAVKHGAFATFTCSGNIIIRVGVGNTKEGAYWTPENKGGNDQVISPITPINEMTNKFTQVYSLEEASDTEFWNRPVSFEGKKRSSLEVTLNVENEGKVFGQNMWSPAGEEVTNVNTPEKPGEIKY